MKNIKKLPKKSVAFFFFFHKKFLKIFFIPIFLRHLINFLKKINKKLYLFLCEMFSKKNLIFGTTKNVNQRKTFYFFVNRCTKIMF